MFDNLTKTSSPTKAQAVVQEETQFYNDQIFTNVNFIREFRQSIQPYQTMIPTDVSLFLKANNLNQLTNSEANETRVENLKKEILNLEKKCLDSSQDLSNNRQHDGLNKQLVNDLKDEFNKANNLIDSFNQCIESLSCADFELPQKNNDLNIEDYYILSKKFQKVCCLL
jgi:hypothetical protein